MTAGYSVPMQMPRLEAALRDCSSESAQARWVAAMALSLHQGERRSQAVEALVGLLDDPVEDVRAQAVEGLAAQSAVERIGSTDLLERLFDDSSAMVRCAVVANMDTLVGVQKDLLGKFLKDREAAVRATTARTIGEIPAEGFQVGLAELLEDEDQFVGFEAGVALARFGDTRGSALVCEALQWDTTTAVRACEALGRLGQEGFVPSLEKVVSGWFVAPELKATAAAALVRCGSSRGKDVLEKMLGGFRQTTRMAALQTLSILPVGGLAKLLQGMIENGAPMEASAAVSALRALADVEPTAARAALGQLVESARGELREEIEEAVSSLEVGG